MKSFPINKYVFILFFVLILAGNSFAAESFRNSLLKTDIYKAPTGEFKINLYTKKPYSDNVVVNKIGDNQYVILLPETLNALSQKPSIGNFSDEIKNIDIKTHGYLNNFKGYTKITISTNKPVLIVPQTLTIKAISEKKNQKIALAQKKHNNDIKKDIKAQNIQTAQQKSNQAIRTTQKTAKTTTRKADTKQTRTAFNNSTNKPATLAKSSAVHNAAAKTLQQKNISKPTTVVQRTKPLNKQNLLADNTIKAPRPQPSVVKESHKVEPTTQKQQINIPQQNSASALQATNEPAKTPSAAANIPAAPSAAQQNSKDLAAVPAPAPAPVNAPTPAPLQANQQPQPQPPVMPQPVNNQKNFLNIYTIGGGALVFLFLLLLIARGRRNKNSARAKNNYQDSQPDFMQENQSDIIDSGGSLFSVAQEEGVNAFDEEGVNDLTFAKESTLDAQNPAWNDQQMQDGFDDLDLDSTYSQQSPEYMYTQDVHQEVDDLFASEEDFGETNPYFEQNSDAEFDSLRNDSEPNFEQQHRPVPTIPMVPTITPDENAEEIDSLLNEDASDLNFSEVNESAFAKEDDFLQDYDETSLDNFEGFAQESAQEPSLDDLFAEEGVNDLTIAKESSIFDEEGVNVNSPLAKESLFDEEGVNDLTPAKESMFDTHGGANDLTFAKESTSNEGWANDLDNIQITEPFSQSHEEIPSVPVANNDVKTEAQPEEVVTSEFEIDDNSGFYVVDYQDFSILVGHIKEEVFILKRFEQKVSEKLQARLNEQKGNTSSYMIKLGRFKAIVDVSSQNMNLVIEL